MRHRLSGVVEPLPLLHRPAVVLDHRNVSPKKLLRQVVEQVRLPGESGAVGGGAAAEEELHCMQQSPCASQQHSTK